MERIYIEDDDDTYLYGDKEYIAFTEDDEILEPYYYFDKMNDNIVNYYPSNHKFIIYDKNYNIIELVHTMTCWSDDYQLFRFTDNKVIEHEDTYRGLNKVNIYYENDKIIDIKYNGRIFRNGTYGKIGDDAPDFSQLFSKNNLLNNKKLMDYINLSK
jgi:hypothetical protein